MLSDMKKRELELQSDAVIWRFTLAAHLVHILVPSYEPMLVGK